MKTATVKTCTVRGVEPVPLTVECAVAKGLPGMEIAGTCGADAAEKRLRVRAALRASGYELADESVAFNVAPSAFGRVCGGAADLAFAVAYLVVTGQVDPAIAEGRLFAGELSLTGSVRGERVDLYNSCRCAHAMGLELVAGALGADPKLPCEYLELASLADLREGAMAVRSFNWPQGRLEARGAEPVLPSGNVMLLGGRDAVLELVRTHVESLPILGPVELAEAASIYSAAKADCSRIAGGERPFRTPHCSITAAGMVGGGRPVRPGEVSLAHGGVLFLEDVQEFSPAVLQALRQPVAEGLARVARADGVYEMPATFQLVCSAPPCPCGRFGDPDRECTCSENRVRAHQDRLRGIAERLGCEIMHV